MFSIYKFNCSNSWSAIKSEISIEIYTAGFKAGEIKTIILRKVKVYTVDVIMQTIFIFFVFISGNNELFYICCIIYE